MKEVAKFFRAGLLLTLATASALCHAQGQASALNWPVKPIRWIVPFGAGGTSDVISRILATKLSAKWGQQVVVDNKPGGNTTIGAVETTRAAPDGYTLFYPLNSTLTINRFLYSKLPYDVKDFTSIAIVADVPVVFVVNAALPISSAADLIAKAKKEPGVLTMGGGAVTLQLASERFSRDANMKLQYVPYKSGVEVTRGLLTGEINLGVDSVVANLPYIKQGKMRALATNSAQRLAVLPDTPTLAELGFKNSEAGMWHALVAPAGMPKDIQQKIQNDLKEVLAMPDVREKLLDLGVYPAFADAKTLDALVASESSRLGPIIRELGLKMD